MNNRVFPGWAGPPVGAVLGGLVGLKAHWHAGGPALWEAVATGAVLGALAGILVWLVDRPPQFELTWQATLSGHQQERPIFEAGSLLGRVFAIVGLLTFWMPIAGLALCIVAAIANHRTQGWPRTASRVGVLLSIAATTVFLALIFLVETGLLGAAGRA